MMPDERVLWDAVTLMLGESRGLGRPVSMVLDLQGQQVRVTVEGVYPVRLPDGAVGAGGPMQSRPLPGTRSPADQGIAR